MDISKIVVATALIGALGGCGGENLDLGNSHKIGGASNSGLVCASALDNKVLRVGV
jgi:hypothetical protein